MSDKSTKEVCKIIDINKDACNFYKSAQQEVKSLDMKDTLQKFENTHQQVVRDLQNYVIQNGGDPEAESTVSGMVQQVWGELKAKVSNDVDTSFIASLEEAEDRCIDSLKDAIQNDDISAEARIALKKQETTLQKCHDYMKTMKENAQAAA